MSTLTQDFHTRLDNLLRTLVHAKPHFVRCIRANATETPAHFDRLRVSQQLRALQVLESVNLMAGGLPHRMRFKLFNSRYGPIMTSYKKLRVQQAEEKSVEDCQLILSAFAQTMALPQQQQDALCDQSGDSCYVNNNVVDSDKFGPEGIQCCAPSTRIHWTIGKRHIFLR
jgi:dachs protein